MMSTHRPVLVFLADGTPPESLISLHSLLSYHEQCALLIYPGDFAALRSRYLSNPFVSEPWPYSPVVYRELGEVCGLLERGAVAGILAQASNSSDARSREEFCAIMEMAPLIPLSYLDMADDAGRYALLSSVPCRYLKGSIFRDFPPPPPVESAPYLHWGLPASGRPFSENGHPRPIDVCFLGSETTHPSRKKTLRLFEKWSRKLAGRVRIALYVSESSDPDRPSQSQHLEVLRQSKICLDLWGHAAQTKRLYEGMWAGCLVLSQAPRWQPNAWTPVEGRHFSAFCSDSDLIEKLEFFLVQEGDRKRVASQGRLWVNETFSAALIGAWLYGKTTGGGCGAGLISTRGGTP